MQRFSNVLNRNRVALTVVADYVYNYLVKSQVHMRSILYGMCSSYDLIKDDCGMGKGTVTIEDNIHKPRATSACLNWKTTPQFHDLNKGLGVGCTIGNDGAREARAKESIQISI